MTRFFINERIVLMVVIINAVSLWMHEFHDDHPFWFWLDYACIIFFLIESSIKLHGYRKNGSWESRWDPIDLAIVLISLPQLFAPFFKIGEYSAVLILRLGRLFRLFRLMRFIPDSQHLLLGVTRALKASVGIFLALCLLNIILGLTAAFLFGQQAPEYFGTPQLAFYSMFKVFTIEGWYELPEHLLTLSAYQSDGWQLLIRAFFSATVLMGGMLGFSLANAIFVDEMVMDNNQELEQRVADLTAEVRGLREALINHQPIANPESPLPGSEGEGHDQRPP